jgi:hypothetical protein
MSQEAVGLAPTHGAGSDESFTTVVARELHQPVAAQEIAAAVTRMRGVHHVADRRRASAWCPSSQLGSGRAGRERRVSLLMAAVSSSSTPACGSSREVARQTRLDTASVLPPRVPAYPVRDHQQVASCVARLNAPLREARC